MSLFLLILIFLFIYLCLSIIMTYLIYKEEKPFYTPIYVSKKPEKEGEIEEIINLHDEFEEYRRRDKPVNIITLFLGVVFFGLIRLLIIIICATIITYKIMIQKKKGKLTKEDIQYIRNITKSLTSFFLKVSGIIVDKKRLPDEKVLPLYQKYFGPEYKIDYDAKFCCYISNHTGFYDLLLAMSFYGCGFVGKEEIGDTIVFGKLSKALDSILVNRNNTGSKNNTLDEIVERQKDFIEGKPVIPFMIYPEGTTSAGRHILRFKKGAFISLMPIKATILQANLSNSYHLSCGGCDVAMNFARSLTQLYVKAEYIELPIIIPNEYMYQNFSHLGKDKWEIFAEVTREIMLELGGFKKSNRGIKDNFRYCSCVEKKTLLDSKTYKIE